jgi:hypothetical protein
VNLDHPSALKQLYPYNPQTKVGLGFPVGATVGTNRKAAPASAFLVRDLAMPGKIDLDRKRGRILAPEVSGNSIVIAPLPSPALAQAGG